jgi:hypothetical protein
LGINVQIGVRRTRQRRRKKKKKKKNKNKNQKKKKPLCPGKNVLLPWDPSLHEWKLEYIANIEDWMPSHTFLRCLRRSLIHIALINLYRLTP